MFTVASYLEQGEAQSLKAHLESLGIPAIIQRCGSPRGAVGVGNYCMLTVLDEYAERASSIEQEYNSIKKNWNDKQNKKMKHECPDCFSKHVVMINKQTWFQKIRFAGVDVVYCEKCEKTYYV